MNPSLKSTLGITLVDAFPIGNLLMYTRVKLDGTVTMYWIYISPVLTYLLGDGEPCRDHGVPQTTMGKSAPFVGCFNYWKAIS